VQRPDGHRQPQRTRRESRVGQLSKLLAHPLAARVHPAQRPPPGRLYGGLEALGYEHPARRQLQRVGRIPSRLLPELAGLRIRAGDKVVVFHASANRDERAFEAPDTLELSRTPNPHVSFGDGPHVCLGAHFARLQLRILYREALRVLPAPRVAGPPVRLVSNFINGIKSLPVLVT